MTSSVTSGNTLTSLRRRDNSKHLSGILPKVVALPVSILLVMACLMSCYEAPALMLVGHSRGEARTLKLRLR
jgi:hypothetical protein